MANKKEPNERLLIKAQALCSRQEKCLSDIRKKLVQWGATPKDIQLIEKSLLADKFIDELRYAQNFTREKARFNKWGPRKIEMALRAKQIASENIHIALLGIDNNANKNALVDLLKKKLKTLQYSNPMEMRSKLIRFAISRGFSYNDIETSLSVILSNNS